MRNRIQTITLAVDDLDRAVRFYRDGLGWATDGVVGTEFAGTDTDPAGAAAMFALTDGLMLSLYPRTELAKDAGLAADAVAGHGFSLGHTVDSVAEVDRTLAEVRSAGGTVVGQVGPRPWGIYSGYFTDPDGHLWEVLTFAAADGD